MGREEKGAMDVRIEQALAFHQRLIQYSCPLVFWGELPAGLLRIANSVDAQASYMKWHITYVHLSISRLLIIPNLM